MGPDPGSHTPSGLSDREQIILRSVIESFVQTGEPVGSRVLARRFGIGLSPASIRNTLSDLEELGYLDHPYTSAGRVPTAVGYRTYVDDLMNPPMLSAVERSLIYAELVRIVRENSELWRESSRLLGRLSNLLGIVLTPRMSKGVFSRIDVLPLSSTRSLFVISVRSGLVKTIVLEAALDLGRDRVAEMVSILNERLAGLTLEQIRTTFSDRLRDLAGEPSGVVGVVMKHASVLFDEAPESRRIAVGGAQHIVAHPEFHDPESLRNIMELLEDEEIVVRLVERPATEEESGEVRVTIGAEHGDEKARPYSIVTASFELGDTTGTVGVLGPMRMDYARIIALVQNMATLLGRSPDGLAGGSVVQG